MFITPKSRQIRLRFRNEEPLKEKATSEKQLSLVAFGRDEAIFWGCRTIRKGMKTCSICSIIEVLCPSSVRDLL